MQLDTSKAMHKRGKAFTTECAQIAQCHNLGKRVFAYEQVLNFVPVFFVSSTDASQGRAEC